jgi:hypothetical protein
MNQWGALRLTAFLSFALLSVELDTNCVWNKLNE